MLSNEELLEVWELRSVNRVAPIFNATYVGKVYSKGRPRMSNKGHVFTPANTRKFEKAVRTWARNWSTSVAYCPISVQITLFDKLPKAMTALQKSMAECRLLYSQVGDVDNRAKSILDGCNGVLYQDDSQISSLNVERYYFKHEGFALQIYRSGLSTNEIHNLTRLLNERN